MGKDLLKHVKGPKHQEVSLTSRALMGKPRTHAVSWCRLATVGGQMRISIIIISSCCCNRVLAWLGPVPFPSHLCIFTHPCIFLEKPKLRKNAPARRTAHRVMAKKKRKGSDKKYKVSRSAEGKQRQDRRDGWTTRRRQLRDKPPKAQEQQQPAVAQ
ncbi:hypothetical protein HaLaN_28112 [Haematococcus lacustris]|uniref:Uncharacterized protein n=1 Tax=Haematococcus lacustris TaxID=44745 RepID=A0A6A0AA15_HAELA|nr:hypothetical protein HaLaN_28112 [Haematococcus lacustris]